MDLITIAKFSETFEANIVKGRLEEEGIECLLQNELIVNTIWMSSDAVGGIKLKVNPSDVQRAKEILNLDMDFDEAEEFIPNGSEEGNAFICPVCGSKSVIETVRPKLLQFLIGLLFAVSAKSESQKYNCTSCRHKWKN